MVPDIRFARNGDVRLAWVTTGDGPRDLVWVPGFVWNSEFVLEHPVSRPWVEHPARYARVILYDKRGQGLSDRPGVPPTLEQGMDDLHAVLDAAGSERATLAGFSEGGPLAILFAASFPERVERLVLWGTTPRMYAAPDFPHGWPPGAAERMGRRLEREWGGPAAIEAFAPSRAGDPAYREWWARLLRTGSSPQGAADLLAMYEGIDVRHALASVRAPTLVMHRRGDRLVPVEAGRHLARHIPDARMLELGGDDHILNASDEGAPLDALEEFVTGTRPAREDIDRVLATVLFTDIVDSTRRSAEAGDRRWRDVVEAHDRAVREELARHRGREIKTMGDGFLATFDGPARGIRCARAITDRARLLGVEVRAGLHTGELELVADDVRGIAVAIGARVGALADGGEVLVSRTVRDLVVGSDLDFKARGVHELKGVPGEWALYALAMPGTQV